MDTVKKYVVSLCVMIAVSILLLVVVSTLTYVFKWKANKAMIGIIVTYVLAGGAGGLCMRKVMHKDSRKRVKEAVTLATTYIFFLWIISYFVAQIPFKFSFEFILIWILVVCSSFITMNMKKL